MDGRGNDIIICYNSKNKEMFEIKNERENVKRKKKKSGIQKLEFRHLKVR